MLRRLARPRPRPPLLDQFGIRGAGQVLTDTRTILGRVLGSTGKPGISQSTLGLLRPDLSLPAYGGWVPSDGRAPIFNLFDRTGGGRGFRYTVTRDRCRDFRGGRLSYDEHDGTDIVCPPVTPLVAAAPGVLVAWRDTFFRGGLTAIVDHGAGVLTQYTHLSRVTAEPGEPLRRGDVVGLSGAAGIDMLTGFPWIPPHIHFMVWVRGRPVDPFRAPNEAGAKAPGRWMHGTAPITSGPLAADPAPPVLGELRSEVALVEQVVGRCLDPRIRGELEAAGSAAGRLAILEDSLHHDRAAWPEGIDVDALRPKADAASVRLTLPLPASDFRGVRLADAPWTRP